MIGAMLIAGFGLGAAGSLHCVGMCGPLSLALPTAGLKPVKRIFYLLSYQAGRVISYAFLGLLVGLAGESLDMAGLQQQFSIIAGIIIFLAAILYWLRKTAFHFSFLPGFFHFMQQLTGKLLYKARDPRGFLLFGIANGFLPCGMIYIALAAAITAPAIGDAVLFMVLFGAGTLPAMMLVGYMGQLINLRARQSMRKAVPFFITLMALVLLLRGLNLGIPFLSPDLSMQNKETIECHE
jgi:sulfite exporter TauE/SafE